MELFKTKVLIEVECLVWADSERQALGVLCSKEARDRMLAESGDPILASIDQWDVSGFEPDYLVYGSDMSLEECLQMITKEAA